MSVSSRASTLSALPVVFGLLLPCVSIPAVHFFAETLARALIAERLAPRMRDLLDARRAALQSEIEEANRFAGIVAISPPIESFLTSADSSAPVDGAARAQAARKMGQWLVGLLDYSPRVQRVELVSTTNEVLVRASRIDGIARIEAPENPRPTADVRYTGQALARAGQQTTAGLVDLSVSYREDTVPPDIVLRGAAPLFGPDGALDGLLVASRSAAQVLFGPAASPGPGLEYHIVNARGDWLARADGTRPVAWRKATGEPWTERFTPVEPAEGQRGADLGRFMGPEGAVLVAETSIGLENDPTSALTLRLATQPSWLAAESAALARRVTVPAYLLLSLLYLSWFFLWLTSRHRLRLANTQSLAARIVDGSPVGLLALRADGEVLSCNRAGLEILGIDREALIGANLFAVARLENDDAVALDASLLRRLAAAAEREEEVALSLKGRTRHLRVSVASIPVSGDADQYVLNIADAHEQRLLRDRLTERNDELERQFRQRTAELETAKDRALSANEIKSEFIANVSHELRTPLHGIAGTLRLLRQDPLNERQSYNLMLAEESVSELGTVINSIIDVSKLEADRLSIEETDISLLAVVHDAAMRFAPRAAEKRLTFIVDDMELGNELVLGDGDRIARIINIIVDNAVKYTDRGSVHARFSSSTSDEEEVLFECAVTDTGRGMSLEQQSRLFEPFYRTEPEATASTTGGVGLGLAIAKQLCHLMNGDLEIASNSGEGTRCTFRIRLALSQEQADNSDAFRPLAGKQVVLVEKEPEQRAALVGLFEKGGARLRTVESVYHIEETHWNDIDFLALGLDALEADAAFIAERTSPATETAPTAVLATAVATTATIERVQGLAENVVLLPLPATTLGLEAALLAAAGEGPRSADRRFDPLSDASHDVWSLLPRVTALVVDDNKVNQHVVGGLLEEYGATVEYADNGEEVLDLLKRKVGRVFDVIFMDCQMPVMDGYEASRRIRAGAAGEAHIDVPIIAVTAAALAGDRMKCLDAGMTDYIVKPVKPSALEQLILLHVDAGGDPAANGAQSEADDHDDDSEGSVRDSLRPRLRRCKDWNREAFERRVMGNMEIVDTISDLYLQNAPTLIDDIDAGLARDDYRAVRHAAHELKGMSENLGSEKVALIAQEIELAALDRRGEDLRYLSGELREHFSRLADVLTS